MANIVAITGGAGALGSALAKKLSARGDKVALFETERSKERAEALAKEIGGFAHVLKEWPAAIEATKAALGGLPTHAALIAGGWGGGRDEATWTKMMQTNADTAHHAIEALLPGMIAAKQGSIVVVGSRAVERPWTSAGSPAYAASKAAVVAFAQAVAAEVLDHGVRINAVLPSTMDTPANRAGDPGADPSKWVSLDSAAGVIAFLLSEDARDISGAMVPIYGRA